MHSSIKEKFVSRLTNIRNYVVADVQLTNGRVIEFNQAAKSEPQEAEKKDKASVEAEEEETSSPAPEKSLGTRLLSLITLNPDKADLYRLIFSLISVCALWILYHMWKRGIIGKVGVKVVQTRLFRLLMKIIFNYKY
jgi:hypothetical protein